MNEERRVRPERSVRYWDETLADGTIYRRYEDGRAEWRTRMGPDTVRWRDSAGAEGTDERLAQGIVKRTPDNGPIAWGRDLGYGRTAWEGGRLLTLNVTRLGGRMGKILAATGAGFLLGAVLAPPDALSGPQEEMLRSARHGGGHGRGGDAADDDDLAGADDLGDAGDDAFG